MSAVIKEVLEDSIAHHLGIVPGDILLSINNRPVKDIIDYQYLSQDEYLEVAIKKVNNERWLIEIEKEMDEGLGLVFDQLLFDRMRLCSNKCIFCFVDQLPKGLRSSLYARDDDYRYSFLWGNFITLTNLSSRDWDKIISLRLSPLYVSVHCTNPQVRAKMLNNPRAASILQDLNRLKGAGIEVHTQVVICPGINDGELLKQTIADLANLYPSVQSIGLVPVGLTGHRSRLVGLRGYSCQEAEELIKVVAEYQDRLKKRHGKNLVYLADEFFIMAQKEIPAASYYDDFPQVENGIGISRLLLDEFAEQEKKLPKKMEPKEIAVITGVSGVPVLSKIIDRLNLIDGLKVTLTPIENKFFGGRVSVTGLLTGSDIINVLGTKYQGRKIILPRIVLRDGEDVFLDGISFRELQETTGADIRVVDGSADSLVNTILSW
ncbi:MAG: DUF512 domain-containing protein [Syntrophomonadaceae bacterium]